MRACVRRCVHARVRACVVLTMRVRACVCTCVSVRGAGVLMMMRGRRTQKTGESLPNHY